MAEPPDTSGLGAPIDVQIARIGQRVRSWREESGLTLQELARRSHLATSTIQKVETAQMIPSVAVLLKLAQGLGRRATELIHESDSPIEIQHVRPEERRRIGREGAMTVERLSADLHDPALEMWRVVLRPGASSGGDTIAYDGEEIVCCERGQVTFAVGDHDHVLEAGDVLHFKATRPHSWRNDADTECCFTVTGTLPHRFRELIRNRALSERTQA